MLCLYQQDEGMRLFFYDQILFLFLEGVGTHEQMCWATVTAHAGRMSTGVTRSLARAGSFFPYSWQ